MKGPESKIVADIVKYLKHLRTNGQKVVWFKVHGSPMQQAGMPDFIIVIGGRTLWVEVKSSSGKVTPLQQHTIQQIMAAGGEVVVVRSLTELQYLVQLEN